VFSQSVFEGVVRHSGYTVLQVVNRRRSSSSLNLAWQQPINKAGANRTSRYFGKRGLQYTLSNGWALQTDDAHDLYDELAPARALLPQFSRNTQRQSLSLISRIGPVEPEITWRRQQSQLTIRTQ
jgi:hypothetical protein